MSTTESTLTRAQLSSLRKPEGIRITDEIRGQFPAVFADAPSSALTDRYQFYPSYRLIEDMDKFGMKLVQLGQQQSTKRDPRHQMHVLRFQPDGSANAPALKVGDSKLELVILNSHNGRNRFQAYAGIFRLVCLNGMVVADQDLGKVRTKHFGAGNSYDVIQELIGGMAQRVGMLGDKLTTWQGITLDAGQQAEFARLAMEVRKFPEWLEPEQLLEARRENEDVTRDGKRDLWTTFNVIQENVMKGDIDRTGAGRPSHTRAVSGAFADVATNVALWEKLEAYTERLDSRAGIVRRPAHEPEVEAAKDKAGEDAVADAPEETKDERRKRLDRERKAQKRAEAKST